MLGMPGMRYVPLDSHTALAQWQFSPFPLLVLASVLITAGWIPLVLFLFRESPLSLGLAMASPLFGVVQITSDLATASPADWRLHGKWALFWIVVFSLVALALLLATLATFDRCLGRITLRASAADPCGRSVPTPPDHTA